MALFTGVQHLCIFSIVASLIYHPLPNVWKAAFTIRASIFVDVSYWQSYNTGKFLSCVVPGSSQWFFHFGEIVITWTHIGLVWWMFQNPQLPAAQEVRDNSSGVTPCIVMKNDGVLYHQMSSFSPERWAKVVLQEGAVVGSIYRLPLRYSMVQYYSINVIHYMNITFTAHCVGHTFYGCAEPGCFHSFHWGFKFGSMSEPRFHP